MGIVVERNMTYGIADEPRVWDDADAELIANRTEVLIQEKFRDPQSFYDLMSGLDNSDIDPFLHRALLNLDDACNGDNEACVAVLQALHRIQMRVKDEMQLWHDECEQTAEREMERGELT